MQSNEYAVSGAADTLSVLLQHSADVICRFGLDKKLHYASPSCVHVLGWTPEELVALPPLYIVMPEDIPTVLAAIESNYVLGIVAKPVTIRNRKKDGTVIWVEVNSSVVRDAAGNPLETVIVIRDVTERKLREEGWVKLAYTDALTGLANRRAFDEELEREWKRTLQVGSQVSLLLLDLDHFKHFNDRHGHQVGDDCLRTVAAAVRESIGTQGTVARYGGEEIAIILPDTNGFVATERAETVRSVIATLNLHYWGASGNCETLTVSIGIASALARCGGTVAMPEGLLLAADNALYRAKSEGRNRVASTLLLAPQHG